MLKLQIIHQLLTSVSASLRASPRVNFSAWRNSCNSRDSASVSCCCCRSVFCAAKLLSRSCNDNTSYNSCSEIDNCICLQADTQLIWKYRRVSKYKNLNVQDFEVRWLLTLTLFLGPCINCLDKLGWDYLVVSWFCPFFCYCAEHSQLSQALSFILTGTE